jgi:hypothetical protein
VFGEKEILNKGGEVPDTKLVLGDLAYHQDTWPNYDDPQPQRKPFLRETPSHQHLLHMFTRVTVGLDLFKKNSKLRPLTEYMGVCLEAFLVLTYHNSYQAWMDEWHRSKGTRGQPALSDLSDATGDSSKKHYTADARGRGKYKGWTDEGIDLYNRICEVLVRQRSDPDPKLAQFEKELMDLFSGGAKKAGNKDKPKRTTFCQMKQDFPDIINNKENDQNQQNQQKNPRQADEVEEVESSDDEQADDDDRHPLPGQGF